MLTIRYYLEMMFHRDGSATDVFHQRDDKNLERLPERGQQALQPLDHLLT